MAGSGGGVQMCTREYFSVLEACGFELTTCVYTRDRRLRTRLRNRLLDLVYVPYWLPAFPAEVAELVQHTSADVIFLNQVAVAPLVFELRKRLGSGIRLILLSHGLESADYVHELQGGNAFPKVIGAANRRKSTRRLGRQLLHEARQRAELDFVFTLSPFETELERWLGAKGVDWLPRTASGHSALTWHPVLGRFGYVGTLDHPPNYAGLRLILDEVARHSITGLDIRIVGGPAKVGNTLAEKYEFVTYLGNLSDSLLEAEATTWTALLHPLFCWARGCSTKLAVALAWRLPIITTRPGCRGYVWRTGKLPLAATSCEFVQLMREASNLEHAAQMQSEVARISSTMPTIAEVAASVNRCLEAANLTVPTGSLPVPPAGRQDMVSAAG
jgi:hypothetical protein